MKVFDIVEKFECVSQLVDFIKEIFERKTLTPAKCHGTTTKD